MKELNSDKLKKFRGGVELEEYCEIMCNMMINNWDSWTWEQQQSAINAWYEHCNGNYPCSVPG